MRPVQILGTNALSLMFALSLMLAWPATGTAESPTPAEPDLIFEGAAYEAGAEIGDRSALVYTELHRQTGRCEDGRWVPATDTVVYRHPNGDERGLKEVDYTLALNRPSYRLVDNKFDERTEVKVRRDGRAEVVHKEHEEAQPQRFEISLSLDDVIDAGFDQMVLQQWDRFMAGETIGFEFLVPARGRTYDFEGVKVDGPPDTAGSHVIRFQPAGMLAGFFADPIFVAYDDRGYLTDYIGLSNLRKDADENHEVHIRFHYHREPDCEGHGS